MLVPRMEAMLSQVLGRRVISEVVEGCNDGFVDEIPPGGGLGEVESGIQRDRDYSRRKASQNEGEE